MTPDDLAKAGTEHAHQRALFAWAAMAERFGFAAANADCCYVSRVFADTFTAGRCEPQPALKRLHAIPNGGQRHKAVAGKLKAEGVKRGVPDVSLPVPTWPFNGFYLEMKKPGELNSTSPEQKDWIRELRQLGYCVLVRDNWRAAAAAIQAYLTCAITLKDENDSAI